ncbi:putative receptor-like protein kinase [Apostasia shenzhenica]|uniref:Putative receptor-like protein kinase n=1 Tax=Apostasia shenzhenica TaxID=1088818 RepID=A0A2I0B1R0_9ASPA|nr:putative receptor-like protein kinase [Apostasia shenzhenica]
MNLHCSRDNVTTLTLPSSQQLLVTAIDYASGITVELPYKSPGCPWLNIILPNTSDSVYAINPSTSAVFVNCTMEFNSSVEDENEAVFISCVSGRDFFVYVIPSDLTLGRLPTDCWMANDHVLPASPFFLPPLYGDQSFQNVVNEFIGRPQIGLKWRSNEVTSPCFDCEAKGLKCGFNKTRDLAFCIGDIDNGLLEHHHGPLLFLLLALALYFHFFREAKKVKETRLRVERFLATYKGSKPTRYTYAAIKKITKRFKHKLGQGGFGSVYKGELPNGIPVAVKMLTLSHGNGGDFINEVATIGRIHHANVVRLLGFCLEGNNYALVYEYMPNVSLEKFIFSADSRKMNKLLNKTKLLDIAIGIAQGIEYLHQGCDQRILHFDIKPHNILLDHNFNPKISDFGLAKLSSRDQSIVTISAARGTMGYIAPEMYSRNFGTVSSKSDVYSFGMLLLEMVSGRRNSDPSVDNSGEIYFPELMYDKLLHGENKGLKLEMNDDDDDDDEIFKKLIIVAMWCIQWNPADRPSISKVVQMLMANMQSLQVPPKPFNPSMRTEC